MPIYTYRCDECGQEFDFKQGINDKPLTECPDEICKKHNHAKASVSRVFSKNIGLVFKGTGFYLTDYKKQNSSGASTQKSSGSDTKPDTSPKVSESSKQTA